MAENKIDLYNGRVFKDHIEAYNFCKEQAKAAFKQQCVIHYLLDDALLEDGVKITRHRENNSTTTRYTMPEWRTPEEVSRFAAPYNRKISELVKLQCAYLDESERLAKLIRKENN